MASLPEFMLNERASERMVDGSLGLQGCEFAEAASSRAQGRKRRKRPGKVWGPWDTCLGAQRRWPGCKQLWKRQQELRADMEALSGLEWAFSTQVC